MSSQTRDIRIQRFDLEGARRVMRLVDALEDLDDVQNVYTSVDISAEVAAGLETDED